MKVFVYESICGGGMADRELPKSLAAEGRAMWEAVLSDFAALADVEVLTTRDERVPPPIPLPAPWRDPAGTGGIIASQGRSAHSDGQPAHPAKVKVVAVGPDADRAAFRRLAALADWTLVIAPELEGTLLADAEAVLEAGGRLLGSSPDAIACTGDKLRLCGGGPWGGGAAGALRRLAGAGSAGRRSRSGFFPGDRSPGDGTPADGLLDDEPTDEWSGLLTKAGLPTPWGMWERVRAARNDLDDDVAGGGDGRGVGTGKWVLKPRFGAGSTATYLIEDGARLRTALAEAEADGFSAGDLIVEPFLPGRAVSVAVIAAPAVARGPTPGKGEGTGRATLMPLPPATQELTADGRFRYQGGMLWGGRPGPTAKRLQDLACRAVAAVPGLAGYVGVDLLMGAAAADDVVIEVNPRLTTSYVALRRACRGNLAAEMLRSVTGTAGERATAPDFPPLSLEFRPDGTVEPSDHPAPDGWSA